MGIALSSTESIKLTANTMWTALESSTNENGSPPETAATGLNPTRSGACRRLYNAWRTYFEQLLPAHAHDPKRASDD